MCGTCKLTTVPVGQHFRFTSRRLGSRLDQAVARAKSPAGAQLLSPRPAPLVYVQARLPRTCALVSICIQDSSTSRQNIGITGVRSRLSSLMAHCHVSDKAAWNCHMSVMDMKLSLGMVHTRHGNHSQQYLGPAHNIFRLRQTSQTWRWKT